MNGTATSAHRRRRRNVIGAPLPRNVISPVFARLHQRLTQIHLGLRSLRVVLGLAALCVVSMSIPAKPGALYLLLGYAVVALYGIRVSTPTLERLLLVSDVIFVPVLVLRTLHDSAAIHVLVVLVGAWIVLNALTGDTRMTRNRIGAFIAMLCLSWVGSQVSLPDLALAAVFCFAAPMVARVQQHRLIGHSIRTAERLQIGLAMRSAHPDDGTPSPVRDIPSTS